MKKNDIKNLKYAVTEILWMARRYADGRRTYAVNMFNEAQQILINILGEEIVGNEDGLVYNFPSATDGDDIEKNDRKSHIPLVTQAEIDEIRNAPVLGVIPVQADLSEGGGQMSIIHLPDGLVEVRDGRGILLCTMHKDILNKLKRLK